MLVGAGTPRHEKAGVVAWYSELAWWILPRPTPTPAGDKPPRYIGLGEIIADFLIWRFAAGDSCVDSRLRGKDEFGQRECRVRSDASWGRPVGVCRAPPWRFANRPYGVVGGWWDAGGQFWAGEFAVRLERGTSPSPRVVFDRATFPPSPPWTPAFAGVANWHGEFRHASTQPQRGTSPPATFPRPAPGDWVIQWDFTTYR